jgi:hypothetical protein
MATRPSIPIPLWATAPASPNDIVNPGDAKRKLGWQSAGAGKGRGEAPPYQWMNHQMNSIGQWIDYTDKSMTEITDIQSNLSSVYYQDYPKNFSYAIMSQYDNTFETEYYSYPIDTYARQSNLNNSELYAPEGTPFVYSQNGWYLKILRPGLLKYTILTPDEGVPFRFSILSQRSNPALDTISFISGLLVYPLTKPGTTGSFTGRHYIANTDFTYTFDSTTNNFLNVAPILFNRRQYAFTAVVNKGEQFLFKLLVGYKTNLANNITGNVRITTNWPETKIPVSITTSMIY